MFYLVFCLRKKGINEISSLLKDVYKKYCLEYLSTPVPKIKTDEILVRIRCSSLNNNDYEEYKPQNTILARLINLFQ